MTPREVFEALFEPGVAVRILGEEGARRLLEFVTKGAPRGGDEPCWEDQ